MLSSVGERIASIRKERDLSQIDLAKLMDVSRQAVSKWENDLTAPDTIRLIQLADVLDTDVEFLASGNHSKLKSPPQIVPVYQTVERTVEVEKLVEVEKIVEKPIVVERIVEVDRPVPGKTQIKHIERVRYLRNPIEFAVVGTICFLIGLLFGHFFL